MTRPGRAFSKIRVAAVQAESVFLDLDATIAKACDLIDQAGAAGAQLIAFPEGYIPTFPSWYESLGDSLHTRLLDKALFKNAVEVPGEDVDALCAACARARVHAVIGINERIAHTTGTLFNTQLHISSAGVLLGKHQKYVPTIGERLVHAPGQTGHVNAFRAEFGAVSGLICGENSNPLGQYAAALAYPVVHVASWPSFFATPWPMHDAVRIASAGIAYSLKCFVVSSVTRISEAFIDAVKTDERLAAYLQEQRALCWGALIVNPNGAVIASGDGSRNDLLFADIDLDEVLIPKFVQDFAGHYNRPELFAPLFANVANPAASES
jgi:nitrilase